MKQCKPMLTRVLCRKAELTESKEEGLTLKAKLDELTKKLKTREAEIKLLKTTEHEFRVGNNSRARKFTNIIQENIAGFEKQLTLEKQQSRQ